jgi:cobalt-zinc-cadmium efflux system membrane fusion protein
MSNNYKSEKYVPYQILVLALIFCWLLLPAGTQADDEHVHQKTQAQGEHQEDTRHDKAQDKHEHDGRSEQSEAHTKEHHHDEHEDVVHLTDAEMEEFGVELDVAGPGKLHMEIVVPGEVTVNYDKLAHIAPRFPGVVTEVKKHIGDNVRKGEVLAIIESNEGLVQYEVKSFINGTVLEKHMTLGEVHSDDVAAFVIADLDTVWVNLSIYQMHLSKVTVGQKVIISVGQEVPDAKGVISYVSPSVDEHTRTATARVVLPNRGGRWCPGLFVQGRITLEEAEVALLVPKSALQNMDDRTVVFVEDQKSYRVQPVEIGRTNNTSAEVLSGLAPGQKYVSEGGFVLKAELLKGAFGDEHGH